MNETLMLLAPADFEALGAVRTLEGLRALNLDGMIWLRGIPELEKADRRVRKLPAQKTYRLGEGNLLFPIGGSTPEGKLPVGEWREIAEFVPVENPVSAMPGQIRAKLPFRLQRSEVPREGEAMLIGMEKLKSYADSAPAHRLGVLKFAVSAESEALVIGTPLPAIPGREFWMTDLLLIPGGYDLEYPVMAGTVSERLNPIKDAVIMLHPDGSWEKIEWEDFVSASRSAIRLTANKFEDRP
jgi:hypothetical protein